MKTIEINVEDGSVEQVYDLLRSMEDVKAIKQQDWDELNSSDPLYLKSLSKSLVEEWNREEDKVWDEIYKKSNV